MRAGRGGAAGRARLMKPRAGARPSARDVPIQRARAGASGGAAAGRGTRPAASVSRSRHRVAIHSGPGTRGLHCVRPCALLSSPRAVPPASCRSVSARLPPAAVPGICLAPESPWRGPRRRVIMRRGSRTGGGTRRFPPTQGGRGPGQAGGVCAHGPVPMRSAPFPESILVPCRRGVVHDATPRGRKPPWATWHHADARPHLRTDTAR